MSVVSALCCANGVGIERRDQSGARRSIVRPYAVRMCLVFVAGVGGFCGSSLGIDRPKADAGVDVLQPEASPVKLPMNVTDYIDEQTAAADEAALMPGPHFVDENGLFSVLVHFDPQQDVPSPNGRASQARTRVRDFVQNRKLDIRHEYTVLPNTINVRGLTQADIDALAKMPGVARVELDEMKHIYLHDSIPLIRGLESQKAAAGHSSATGAGTRVCIIDTGINASHILFTGKIDTAAGWDFYNNDSNPADDNGHGSNVAGIAAGLDGFSVTFGTCGAQPFQGVAPDATIIAVKVCSGSGSCPTSAIVAGINHCASTSLPGGQADVINLSLGGGQFSGTCNSDSSALAANNAVAAGVTVIAASGNNGFSNAMGSPACGSQVIAVGAVYDSDFPNCQDADTAFTWCLNSFCSSTCTDSAPVEEDELICFSNRSVNLDVTAPGGAIWSAGSSGTSSIIEMFGTSQASPHVAGLAALILGQDPSLTPAEVRQLLRDGAVDLGATGFDSSYGWGRIDVINTLDLVGGGCQTNGDCDDGLFCNGAETCNTGTGQCQAGTPPNCNDGVACTDDSCNESTDSCNNVPNYGNCSDGLFCNGSETCHATLGCQAGSPPNCNDGVACTDDSCNESTDSCNNVPNNGNCSDGLFCNGSETCHATLGCQAGSPPNCNDGVACTDDSCNESTDSCNNVANNANCDDALFCNGAETCHATLGCQAGSDPCPGQSCNESTDQCVACITNGDCDDGLFCNGAETCSGGTCQAGSAPNCNDGVACTNDSCNESTDSCDNTANDANCDDGLFCNGAETCHATLGCQSGTDPCAPDPCDEGTDTCGGGDNRQLWVTFQSNTSVPGVGTVTNDDIVVYDFATSSWSLMFDGSDVGISSLVIGALSVLDNGDLLMSFTAAGTVPGLIGGPNGTSVDDSDIVRFTPNTLGPNTSGTFTFHFDGSDVALTANSEDFDAIGIHPDGRLLVSVTGGFSGTGASGQDEDLFVFTASSLGSVTSGSFALFFDGSDVGLSNSASEDVDSVTYTPDGTLLLSTIGSFSVSGASGGDLHLFEFFPTQFGSSTQGTFAPYVNLTNLGISSTANPNTMTVVWP